MADFILEAQRSAASLAAAEFLSYLTLFRSLKNYFGLSRLVHAYTGGAPLGPEIFKMFLALGVRIKQAYGATETTAASVVHRTDNIRLTRWAVRCPESSCAHRTPASFWSGATRCSRDTTKNPEATAKALQDGWFHSGDAAIIDDDGQVIIIDRMADVMKLSDGSKFSPADRKQTQVLAVHLGCRRHRTRPPLYCGADFHRPRQRRQVGRRTPDGVHHL